MDRIRGLAAARLPLRSVLCVDSSCVSSAFSAISRAASSSSGGTLTRCRGTSASASPSTPAPEAADRFRGTGLPPGFAARFSGGRGLPSGLRARARGAAGTGFPSDPDATRRLFVGGAASGLSTTVATVGDTAAAEAPGGFGGSLAWSPAEGGPAAGGKAAISETRPNFKRARWLSGRSGTHLWRRPPLALNWPGPTCPAAPLSAAACLSAAWTVARLHGVGQGVSLGAVQADRAPCRATWRSGQPTAAKSDRAHANGGVALLALT